MRRGVEDKRHDRARTLRRPSPTLRQRWHRALALSLVSIGISTMAAQTPAFITIAKGDASGLQDAKQVTVRTAAEWTALWKDHSPAEKMPAVDFAKHMVVGIFLGSKPSAGYAVEIVNVRNEEKDLIVEYVQKQPGRGTMAAQILTEPFHLVAVPKHAGTVRFIANSR
jgi:hypothetical protein